MGTPAFIALSVVLCATPVAGQCGADRILGLDVAGTVFRIHLASGKVRSGHDLVGATLSLTQPGATAPSKVRVE